VGERGRASASRDDELIGRLTGYWRRIQVAASLEGTTDERDDGAGDGGRKVIRQPFTLDAFLAGRCPVSLYEAGFRAADKAAAEKGNDRVEQIDVVFSPFGLKIPGERNPVHVLFGSAHVDRNGVMSAANVESDLPPIWIGRAFLHPSDGIEGDLFPLADADRYHEVVAQALSEREQWPAAWPAILDVSDQLWQDASGVDVPLPDYLATAYPTLPGWIRVEERDPKTLTIVRMYERIARRVEEGHIEPLYREAILGTHRRVFAHARSQRHLGQMSAKGGLAASQRRALLAYLNAPAGTITAVNGPPGTGKTTLLQSIVASEMVARALEQGEAPIFVATAATNQAVANVISAFRGATEGLKHPLADRWLPFVGRRYGVYFRGSKGEGVALARGSIVCLPHLLSKRVEDGQAALDDALAELARSDRSGDEVFIDHLLRAGESEAWRSAFVRTASDRLGREFADVADVTRALHGKLEDVTRAIVLGAQAADRYIDTIDTLMVREHGTYANAADALATSAARAETELSEARAVRAAADQHDLAAESALRAREDDQTRTFDQEAAAAEAQAASLGAARDRELAQAQAGYDGLRTAYAPIGPPTSFSAWFAQTFLPWRANELRMRLRQLADAAHERGLGTVEARDVVGLRAGLDALLEQRKRIIDERARVAKDARSRATARAAQRSRFVEQIEGGRRRREAALEARMRARRSEVESITARLAGAIAGPTLLRDARAMIESAWKRISLRVPEGFDKVEEAIDTNLRVEAFLLATHYWEGRFLQTLIAGKWRVQQERLDAFRTIAMLTPCFVSTFDKLGMAFNVMKHGVVHPLWGFADTLIVDEAGQASPDKGAFAFTLAKKAVVVGDNLQLPPVTTTEASAVLSSIAEAAGVLHDEFLIGRGMLTGRVGAQRVGGSIMRMASAASYFDMSSTSQGMWLREHFRCDPRIIAFCNEVWYTGETSLIPRREKRADGFLPYFGHVHVAGTSRRRTNEEEAHAIMDWLNAYGARLQDDYDLPLHEIVAVLTPFSNQRFLLRATRDRYAWSASYASPRSIVMGTVHALQGAERPVVLFSTMYDGARSEYFFDNEHTLLNVAVSRAKDSFLVFGHRAVFTSAAVRSATQPSTFLRPHLFAEDAGPVPLVPTQPGRGAASALPNV
jgi:hypothetical protein